MDFVGTGHGVTHRSALVVDLADADGAARPSTRAAGSAARSTSSSTRPASTPPRRCADDRRRLGPGLALNTRAPVLPPSRSAAQPWRRARPRWSTSPPVQRPALVPAARPTHLQGRAGDGHPGGRPRTRPARHPRQRRQPRLRHRRQPCQPGRPRVRAAVSANPLGRPGPPRTSPRAVDRGWRPGRRVVRHAARVAARATVAPPPGPS